MAQLLHIMDYTISIAAPQQASEWPFVRLYDKIVAQRDETFIVQRADVAGKSPEQLRDFFCLSFTPEFICDASVPLGGVVTLSTLRNQAGERARIYLAKTRLELANERSLMLESIAPITSPIVPAALLLGPIPIVPFQPSLPDPVDPEIGFNISNAEQHLRQFHLQNLPPVKIHAEYTIVGPDGFPYVRAQLSLEGTGQGKKTEVRGADLRGNLVQSLLEEGMGLALWRGEEQEPIWVYKYRDVLCLKLFNSLRLPPEFDEALYPDTVDKPLPSGSRVVTGHPSDHLYPSCVRRILNQRIASAIGHEIALEPRLMDLPDIDTLRRFRLDIKHFAPEVRQAIAAQAHWCLPYVIYY